MNKYTIYLDGKRVKTYPFKLQCIMWAYGHGYVYSSRRCE